MSVPSRPGARWLTWCLLALLLGASAALRRPYRSAPFERDEGAYAYVADRLSHGELPYRDVFDHKPPGVHALYWLSFKLFGRSVSAPRDLATLCTLGSIVAIFLLLRRTHGAAVGLAGAAWVAAGAFGTIFLSFTANTEIFMMLPLAASMLFLWRGYERGSWLDFLIAGLLNGAAMVIKQVAVTNFVFALLFALIAARRGGARRMAVWAGCVGAGALIPLGLCVLIFAAAGGLAALLRDAVLYNFTYYSMPWPEREERLLSGFEQAIGAAPLLWLLAATGLVQALRRRRSRDWALLGWLLFSLPGVCGAGSVYPHYFLQVLPALGALAAVGTHEIADGISRLALRRAGGSSARQALCAALTGAVVCASMLWTVVGQWPYLTRYGPQEITARVFPNQAFALAPQIGGYLRVRTAPDEPVFIFGSEPEIYFYAQRACPVRYAYVYPLTARSPDAAERQREVIAALQQAPPRYLVLVGYDLSVAFQPGAGDAILRAFGALVNQGYYLDGFTAACAGGTELVFGREAVEQSWQKLRQAQAEGAPCVYLFRKRGPGEDYRDPLPWLFGGPQAADPGVARPVSVRPWRPRGVSLSNAKINKETRPAKQATPPVRRAVRLCIIHFAALARRPSLLQRLILSVGHLVRRNQDQVDQPPDPTAAEGDELQDAQADVTKIEPVDAKLAQEDGQQQGNDPLTLGRWRRRGRLRLGTLSGTSRRHGTLLFLEVPILIV